MKLVAAVNGITPKSLQRHVVVFAIESYSSCSNHDLFSIKLVMLVSPRSCLLTHRAHVSKSL